MLASETGLSGTGFYQEDAKAERIRMIQAKEMESPLQGGQAMQTVLRCRNGIRRPETGWTA